DAYLSKVVPVLDAFLALQEKPVFVSREVWTGLRQAAGACVSGSARSLRRIAWEHRDLLRRTGRKPPRHCLATPLLVKGLEFDHALILDAADFPDAESLYVCLTRASRSVTLRSEAMTLSALRAAPGVGF